MFFLAGWGELFAVARLFFLRGADDVLLGLGLVGAVARNLPKVPGVLHPQQLEVGFELVGSRGGVPLPALPVLLSPAADTIVGLFGSAL